VRWRKLGLVYKAEGSSKWARTHAMCPTPLLISNRVIRIYVTCRDDLGVGRIGFVEVCAHDPTKVLKIGSEPLLDAGRPGTFDDNGVMASSVVCSPGGRIFLYYVGFELSVHIRYRALAGLAISDDGLHFKRVQETPILERSPAELYFRGGPYVRCDEGRYRMWYVGGSQWIDLGGKQMPVYDLRYMESGDGIHWPGEGQVALPISGEDEHGFGRPWVVRTDTGWELFYSIRRRSLGAYRMGYSVSADGATWQRRDAELGLDASDDGWDSQAVCYAAPVTVGGYTWLFYNGNNFGETGFGVAVRED
jgi:predicted GH43/DUF377 family glycosyl hydrolase